MNKKIYFEPNWRKRSNAGTLIDNPPLGYEFIAPVTTERWLYSRLAKYNTSYKLFHRINKYIPMTLLKSYVERYRRISKDAQLTFASEHLIFRKQPWIVDTEYVSLLVGFHPNCFKKYKNIVQKALSSKYCKGIICWHEAARRTILSNLDPEEIEGKITLAPLTVYPKNFIKFPNEDSIKIIFFGSANIMGEFWTKGGIYVIEVCKYLSHHYDNLEFVIRSDMPNETKQECLAIPGMRVIDKIIPWEDLERELMQADIALLPAHNTPWMAFLDAMSYELPVVTIDAWANSEMIENGKTGLLTECSKKIPYYIENGIPNFGTHSFEKAVKTPDPYVIGGLIKTITTLINNPELRKQMGKAGRWEIEHGKFSLENRNQKLKRIFDEATGDADTSC